MKKFTAKAFKLETTSAFRAAEETTAGENGASGKCWNKPRSFMLRLSRNAIRAFLDA